MKLVTIISFCLIWFHPPVISQGMDMEKTLEFINNKLQPEASLIIIRGELIANFYKEGVLVREDQVMCKDLDIASLNYDSQFGVIAINCKTGKQCVYRKLHTRNIHRDYSRISFPVKQDQSNHQNLIRAFENMIKLVVVPGYQAMSSFE